MNHPNRPFPDPCNVSGLANRLGAFPPGQRAQFFHDFMSPRAYETWAEAYGSGEQRAIFADLWEGRIGRPLPLSRLTAIFGTPPATTALLLAKLELASNEREVDLVLAELIDNLAQLLGDSRWHNLRSFPN
jgi:hypothetical protein